MSSPAAKPAASERLLIEIAAVSKQIDELHRSTASQYTTMMSEFEALKEKVANASTKKTTTRAGGARAASVPTPSGNKKYNNKMLWWKDTFAANYEQYSVEFFNEELESQDLLTEAEADFNESKNKDKEGVAKYKIMADYIWKNYLKTDKKTDDKKAFREAVFKKFDDYNLESGSAVEATAETGDDAEPNVAATEDDDAPNDNADAEGDEDDEEKPKKTTAKAAPKKAAAAPKAAAKAPVKTAAKAAKAAPKAAAKGAAKAGAKK